MIYSRVPQSAKDDWKDEVGIEDEDMEGVLAWMQKQGGRG